MSIDLQRLQRTMQRAIVAGTAPPAFVQGRDAADRARRFGIYAVAYRSRLQEALAYNFPVLQAQVGDAEFATLATAYIDAHPSAHPSIRAFGEHLAQWLSQTRPEAPALAELARFEWLLGCAFDAPDDPPMSIDALAAIEPDQWANLRFRFARSVHRVTCRTNAPMLYDQAGDRDPEADEPEAAVSGEIAALPEQWLLWRQQLATRYRSMTDAEALAFDALASGATFGAMCALLLEHFSEDDAPVQAAACLKRWLSDELIATFSLAVS